MEPDLGDNLELLKYIAEHQHEFDVLMREQANENELSRNCEELQCNCLPVEPIEACLPTNHDTPEIAEVLKDTAQNMTEYHAEYEENRRADAVKAEKDKKQGFRHDFFVAAFSAGLALILEHFSDIIKFVLELFSSLS